MGQHDRFFRYLCSGFLGLFLVGCAETIPLPNPDGSPLMTAAGSPEAAIVSLPASPRSLASQNLARHYHQMERGLIASGDLRRNGGEDIPVDATRLVESFAEVALRNEYAPGQGLETARSSLRPVRRWASPVRVSLTFGSGAPSDIRRGDRLFVAQTVTRLTRITGHSISLTERNPNFHVFVVGRDDRETLLERVQILSPGLQLATLSLLSQMPRDVQCLVFTREDTGTKNTITQAVAVIRAELGPVMRQSCYHEEIAQGLGLSNDSPLARPSVFNDDDEFAYLTHLDDDLLRLLYNPGMPPGLAPGQARQRARALANTLRPPLSEGF